jgi:hypothetical protein
MIEPATTAADAQLPVAASTQVLELSRGVYRFSVAPGSPTEIDRAGDLILPAVYFALGPSTSVKAVNLMPGPSANGTWLSGAGDLVFAGVSDDAAKLLVTSIPAANGDELEIAIERVDGRADSGADRVIASTQRVQREPVKSPAAEPPPPPSPNGLRLRIVAHIRNRGDLAFVDVPWAGRVGQGMWIEAFAVTPLERITPADIEYRGLTASGFETPWVSGGETCGTYAKADPLVAFAARLRPRSAGPDYRCEYGGTFRSGAIVEAVKDGALCRSTAKNDPLEGIQVRIMERQLGMPDEAPAPSAGETAIEGAERSKAGKTRRQGEARAAKPV